MAKTKIEARPFAIELYDKDDNKTLCYFADAGDWVRKRADAKTFVTREQALPDYSLIQMHFLYVRVVEDTATLKVASVGSGG